MRAARGDVPLAFALYRWNIEASAAIYETLHLGEVVLRNAMDDQLRVRNSRHDPRDPGSPRGSDWTLDPCLTLQGLVGRDLPAAHRRAAGAVARSMHPRDGVTHGDVVAQLTFGTWRYLMPSRTMRKSPSKAALWHEGLRHAFPYLVGGHELLVDDVTAVHGLRNRIAHLEPLIRPGVIERGTSALRRVVAAISPDVCAWYDDQARTGSVLEARPRT